MDRGLGRERLENTAPGPETSPPPGPDRSLLLAALRSLGNDNWRSKPAPRPYVASGSRLCENVHEPRMPRIVFSIAFFREKLPVQLVSASMKSRRKFYTQVRRRSFHTARVTSGKP